MELSSRVASALPPKSRQKLLLLQADRTAAQGGVAAALDRYQAEIQRAERLAVDADIAERDRAVDEEGQTARRASAEAATANIAHFRAAYERACSAFHSFIFLQSAEEWLARKAAIGDTFKPSPSPVPLAGRDPVSAVAELRQRIAKIDEEIEEHADLPRSPDAALADMLAELRSLAESGAPRIDLRRGGDPANLRALVRPGSVGGLEQAVAFLTWVLEPVIVERLQAAFSEARQKVGAIKGSADAAKLLRQKLASEREEEALIEELAARGQSIARRPDMDPRALLGLA